MGHADFEPKRNRLSAGVWGARRQQMEWLTMLVLLAKFSKIILVTFIFIENFANAQTWGRFFSWGFF